MKWHTPLCQRQITIEFLNWIKSSRTIDEISILHELTFESYHVSNQICEKKEKMTTIFDIMFLYCFEAIIRQGCVYIGCDMTNRAI